MAYTSLFYRIYRKSHFTISFSFLYNDEKKFSQNCITHISPDQSLSMVNNFLTHIFCKKYRWGYFASREKRNSQLLTVKRNALRTIK